MFEVLYAFKFPHIFKTNLGFNDILDSDEDNDSEDEEDTPEPKSQPPKKKVHDKRHSWKMEEEAELRVLFKNSFERKFTPNQKMIRAAMKTSQASKGYIHKLKIENIKKKVCNMIQNLKKT